MPKFLYGAASTDTGEGVLVLEDLSVKGFSTFDPAMMLLDLPHMQVSLFFCFLGVRNSGGLVVLVLVLLPLSLLLMLLQLLLLLLLLRYCFWFFCCCCCCYCCYC